MPQTQYKLFADLLYAYESSVPANTDVDFYVRRLRGISRFQKSLWPELRAPGRTTDRKPAAQIHSADSLQFSMLETPDKYQRVIQLLHCPGMEVMKTKYGIPPVIVVKTAVAIFNSIKTGQDYAIFTHVNSGRDWPFILPWMKKSFPPAMSIDGPTIEWCLNMIQINGRETAGELLRRIKNDQEEEERHIHAPWQKILEKLGEEGRDATDAIRRQVFNWDVNLSYLLGKDIDSVSLKPISNLAWPEW